MVGSNWKKEPKPYPDIAAPPGVVFHVHGISKIYHMGDIEVSALRAVDLDLYEGEFVVLLGPSGSGKSTLLNILGGLDVPSSDPQRVSHKSNMWKIKKSQDLFISSIKYSE
jgi:ABC-type lipoprotein export system ATPase subunit